MLSSWSYISLVSVEGGERVTSFSRYARTRQAVSRYGGAGLDGGAGLGRGVCLRRASTVATGDMPRHQASPPSATPPLLPPMPQVRRSCCAYHILLPVLTCPLPLSPPSSSRVGLNGGDRRKASASSVVRRARRWHGGDGRQKDRTRHQASVVGGARLGPALPLGPLAPSPHPPLPPLPFAPLPT
jgi:hypothetical protein